MVYRNIIRPIMTLMSRRDPEIAHESALRILVWMASMPSVLKAIRKISQIKHGRALEQELFGIKFPNPIGLAAGFDKNCVALEALGAFGFGFIEAGTVVRKEQAGNPRPRIYRIPKDAAIINRMGFPSDGAQKILARISRQAPPTVPVGLSIGKMKDTPLENAVDDYLYVLDALYPYADYFVVNISSPNTPGLRALHEKKYLDELLREFVDMARLLSISHNEWRRKPILIKIDPDLSLNDIGGLLDVALNRGINGVVAVNTTLSREWLKTGTNKQGGLSGRPLYQRALGVISFIRHECPKLPIIGVGGILSPMDAYNMFKYGASMVQTYTGFIYEGPFFPRQLNNGLLRIMRKNGQASISHISHGL